MPTTITTKEISTTELIKQIDPKYVVLNSKGEFVCSYGTGWSLKDIMRGSGPDVHKVVLRIFSSGEFLEIAEFMPEDFNF